MKSKLTHLLAVATAFFCLAPMQTQAVNINTHGATCQDAAPYLQPVNRSTITTTGILNGNFELSTMVLCNVARSPLPAGATAASFYVDGDNPFGETLLCNLLSYDYTGALLGVAAFSTTSTTFDQLVTMPAAQVPTWAYVVLFCRLPELSQIRGITSLQ